MLARIAKFCALESCYEDPLLKLKKIQCRIKA